MWLKKKRCHNVTGNSVTGNSVTRNASRIIVGLILCATQSVHLSLATENCIAVYYPDADRPYDAVFKQILSGIEQGVEIPIRRYLVDQTKQNSSIAPLENSNECAAMIGLGRGGLKVATESNVPAIVGAVIAQPDEITTVSGVSLVPQPEEMFKRLTHFAPYIKSVFVVFNPENNGKLIHKAVQVATQFKIKLQAIPAIDLKSAFAEYKNIMEKINAKESALWFLHDPATVDTKAILPFALKQAWRKKLVIFSNQAGHAKSGVLFSVYPDNIRLGKRLGNLAQNCVKFACATKKVMLLNDLFTAVNIRTANRLGIRLNTRRDPYITVIFPRR